jgi:hypothetical protein
MLQSTPHIQTHKPPQLSGNYWSFLGVMWAESWSWKIAFSYADIFSDINCIYKLSVHLHVLNTILRDLCPGYCRVLSEHGVISCSINWKSLHKACILFNTTWGKQTELNVNLKKNTTMNCFLTQGVGGESRRGSWGWSLTARFAVIYISGLERYKC